LGRKIFSRPEKSDARVVDDDIQPARLTPGACTNLFKHLRIAQIKLHRVKERCGLNAAEVARSPPRFVTMPNQFTSNGATDSGARASQEDALHKANLMFGSHDAISR